MDKRDEQQVEAASMQKDTVYINDNPLLGEWRKTGENEYIWEPLPIHDFMAELKDAAAVLEGVYRLLSLLAVDVPPDDAHAPELYAALEEIDAWRERAREAGE